MPRAFGKARLELTVTETWRERAAARNGVDPNIEVTKKAAEVLEAFADTGSYWSPQDKKSLRLLTGYFDRIHTTWFGDNGWANRAINGIDKLLAMVDFWKNTAYVLSAGLTAQNLENQRLRALLEEHSKGCPASELK